MGRKTLQAVGETDVKYESMVVAVLALGTALVGIDRYMVLPMFPTLARDLNFNYADIGLITGSLGFAYGISAALMGYLSDRVGRRSIIIWATFAFSLAIGLTGLAGGLLTLCLLRAVMGVADGAFMTPAIVTILETSRPGKKGRNLGIMLMMMPLFGLALAPIAITQLLTALDWRWVFLIVAPVGILATILLAIVLRPVAGAARANARLGATTDATIVRRPYDGIEAVPSRWRDLFGYRNVPLCMVAMFSCLTAAIALAALLPSYMVDYLHLSVTQMGFVLSATGFGGALGNFVIPTVSDHIGRRAVALIAAAGTTLSIVALMYAPANTTLLFAILFVESFFIFPFILIIVGPAVVEAVPSTLRSSAAGLITLVGEILGGSIAPILAGYIAQTFGIQHIFILPIAVMVLSFVVCLFLVETAPLIVRRQTMQAPAE